MKKLIKKFIRFLARFIFVWTIIITPFILCAIVEKNKVFGAIVLITSAVLGIKETIR